MIRSHRIVFLVFAVSACGHAAEKADQVARADSVRADSVRRARQDSINRAQPGYVIDSTFPVEEELRRFRAKLGGDSATVFHGGSTSLDALARRFMRALAANDTNDLRAMVITSREFADLYYPESPYSRKPYHQPPELFWTLMQDPSVIGLTRLIRRYGGKRVPYLGTICDPKVLREGRNTRYAGCLVRVLGEKGDTVNRRFFGSVVERGGQFKFLSYTNSL